MNYRLLASAGALALLSGCVNVASMDCSDIAEQAKRISQNETLKITEIRNTRETSRTEREARCTAQATFSDNQQRDLELRAYYEGDNTMVQYTERPSGGASQQPASEEGGETQE